METEWDCLAEIHATTQELATLAPTIEHIKGHQDSNTLYEELSLLAQLNCNADIHICKLIPTRQPTSHPHNRSSVSIGQMFTTIAHRHCHTRYQA